ncbi:MAG: hypothetical protein VB081_02780 [Christensenella sp.]|uniref:hypothetical protein n=1 Tax=Christensenella sp. TaxID=1935934 RepID=UPI002B204B05|nr:hypothetical protein [Christensenella sp.]MEA5002404.1 hypothetical protein [Christensenella sp.]
MQKIERELYKYGDLKEQAREIEEDIREFAAKKVEIVDSMLRAPMMDRVRVQGGQPSDPVYDVVEKLVDVYDAQIAEASARLKEIYTQYERMKERIVLAGLDEYERRYIKRRYVDRISHMAVASEIGYCERQLSRIRASALKKITGKR